MEIMTSKWNRYVSPSSSYSYWGSEERGLFLRLEVFELHPHLLF